MIDQTVILAGGRVSVQGHRTESRPSLTSSHGRDCPHRGAIGVSATLHLPAATQAPAGNSGRGLEPSSFNPSSGWSNLN